MASWRCRPLAGKLASTTGARPHPRHASVRQYSRSRSIYQIPNTEHMAYSLYRLVRTLVYKRGVGIRETVWVGVWFGKSTSVWVGLCLPAEPRRRSVPLHGVLHGGGGGRQR
eukprot:scaffold72570_cov44-Phaeocystis_antarctica.AAC.1